jgi:MinD-like ATPase involved in chromosome partitioning or flagellar assembly/FixJ family two-component response regulator
MSDEIRCLVVSADSVLAASLVSMLEAAHGVRPSGVLDPSRALSGVVPASDVMLVCDGPGQPALSIAAPLLESGVVTPVVLASRHADLAAFQAAMVAGARGLVELPADPGALARSIVQAGRVRRTATVASEAGRVVVVCAARGGAGASSVATALAICGTALLVDLAPGFDNAAERLGCTPVRTIADLAALGGGIASEAVIQVASRHPGGMRLVAAPSDPDAFALIPPDVGSSLVRAARGASRTTVVDAGVPTGELAGRTAAAADRILVVTTPDVRSVECASSLVRWLDRRGVPPAGVGLVVNRWRRSAELSLRGIERTVSVPIACAVRHDDRLERGETGGGPWCPRPLRDLAERLEAA